MVRSFWLPLILAAAVALGTMVGVIASFQRQARDQREMCARGMVWACTELPR